MHSKLSIHHNIIMVVIITSHVTTQFPHSHTQSLQVLYRPHPKRNRSNQPPKRKDKYRSIPPIQGSADTISHLLGISSTWSGALRTTESRSLFLKVHPRTFRSIVYVTAILADPFPRPVFGCLGFLLGFLSLGLSVPKDGEGRGGGGGNSRSSSRGREGGGDVASWRRCNRSDGRKCQRRGGK